MTPTRRSLATLPAAALVAALALTGCTDDDAAEPTTPVAPAEDPVLETQEPEEDAGPATAAPDDVEPTTAPADQEEATAAPADQEEATAAPADDPAEDEDPGEELTAADDSFSLTLPEGWEDAADIVDAEAVLLAAKEIERQNEFYTNVVVTQEEYVGNLTSAVEETAQQLAGEDGEYELLDPAPVDGNLAPGYTLVRDVQGSTVHQTQRWVSHEGTLYVVTFSAIDSRAEDVAGALDDMLASWTWND